MDERYSDDLFSLGDKCSVMSTDSSRFSIENLLVMRKADNIRNILDQLLLKRERQISLDKYFESLTNQLSENFRLAMVELYSKRNTALAALDSLLDSASEKLKQNSTRIMNSLNNLRSQNKNKIPEIDGLINKLKKKLLEENLENYSDLIEQSNEVIAMTLDDPQVNFDTVKIDVSSVHFKARCEGLNVHKGTQTERINDRGSLQTRVSDLIMSRSSTPMRNDRIFRNHSNCSVSSVYKQEAKHKIPFLGINKIKVYLPQSYNKFSIVSISPQTTAAQVVDGLMTRLAKTEGNYYLEVNGEDDTFVLSPCDFISDVLSGYGKNIPMILLVKG